MSNSDNRARMPGDQMAPLRRYFNELADVLDANARIGGVDGHPSDTGRTGKRSSRNSSTTIARGV